MSEVNVELTINIENIKEVQRALEQFPNELKDSMFRKMQVVSNREEKILKGTSGFRDRTGRSRRSLFVTATFNPVGIEMGSFLPHMNPLAFGHGTWQGGWWEEYIKGMASRVPEDIKAALVRAVKEFANKYKDV